MTLAGTEIFAIDTVKAAAIIDSRTAMLAAGATPGKRKKRLEFLKLEIGAERYALPLKIAAAVVAGRALGPIVSRRPEIVGTLYERAEVWPVYSLRALLGAGEGAQGKTKTFLLLRHETRRVALAADRIEALEGVERAHFAKTAAGPLVSGATPEGLMLIEEGALWRHPALTHGRLS